MLIKIDSHTKVSISDVIQTQLSDRMAAAAAHAVKHKRKLEHKEGAGVPPINTPARHGWGEMALELHGDVAKVTMSDAESVLSAALLTFLPPWISSNSEFEL